MTNITITAVLFALGVSQITWRKTNLKFNKREVQANGKFTKCSLLARQRVLFRKNKRTARRDYSIGYLEI